MTLPPYLIEAAQTDDIEALAALERRCYSHPWTTRGFRDALRRPPERGLVIVARAVRAAGHERGLIGYCVIETVADEVHVHNLAVRPESQGSGLGRHLLVLGLAAGARRGARVALLEVRASNRAALELYRSMDFVAVARRRNYYAQPAEDALVLRKEGLEAYADQP